VRIARQGFVGSADAVRSAAVDLVVANISPEAIIALAPEFARVLRAGGTLVASGFNASEVEAVKAALPTAREVRQKGEWAAILGCGGATTMKEIPSLDDQIKFLEDFRETRNRYMERVLALRDRHEAARNGDAAAAAQREYGRLIRNDDKLLDRICELQDRKP